MRTLEFLQWLGVDVPRWIENDLKHAADTLEASRHRGRTQAVEGSSGARTGRIPGRCGDSRTRLPICRCTGGALNDTASHPMVGLDWS